MNIFHSSVALSLALVGAAGCSSRTRDDSTGASTNALGSCVYHQGLVFANPTGEIAVGNLGQYSYTNLTGGKVPAFDLMASLSNTGDSHGTGGVGFFTKSTGQLAIHYISGTGVFDGISGYPNTWPAPPTLEGANWEHVVGTRDLLFFWTDAGAGMSATVDVNASPSVTLWNRWPSGSFRTGLLAWTNVVPNYRQSASLLFFNKSTGANVIGTFSENAPYLTTRYFANFSDNGSSWTHVTAVEGGHFFYNARTGHYQQVLFDTSKPDGAAPTIVYDGVSAGWTQVVGTGFGSVLLYRADTGTGMTYFEGSLNDIQRGFLPWQQIVPAGDFNRECRDDAGTPISPRY